MEKKYTVCRGNAYRKGGWERYDKRRRQADGGQSVEARIAKEERDARPFTGCMGTTLFSNFLLSVSPNTIIKKE